MVKTEWLCDDCGEKFNSRSARLYHRNHTCKAEGKQIISDDPAPVVEPPKPDPVVRDVVVGAGSDYPQDGSIEHDEPLESFDGDNEEIPVVFIFVAVFCLMIISGAVIFREKIIEFFRRRGKPPAYGVPHAG